MDAAEIEHIAKGLFGFTHGLEDAQQFRFIVVESAHCLWVYGEEYFKNHVLFLRAVLDLHFRQCQELMSGDACSDQVPLFILCSRSERLSGVVITIKI